MSPTTKWVLAIVAIAIVAFIAFLVFYNMPAN